MRWKLGMLFVVGVAVWSGWLWVRYKAAADPREDPICISTMLDRRRAEQQLLAALSGGSLYAVGKVGGPPRGEAVAEATSVLREAERRLDLCRAAPGVVGNRSK